MKVFQDPLFQALFNSPVPRIIVKADAPVFTIVVSNDAHKIATHLVGKDIAGKSVWETFDPAEAGGNGGQLLLKALSEAQATNKTVLMPPFRYDMGALSGPGMVEKWWKLEIMPIGGDTGAPSFLLTTTNDITEQVEKARSTEIAKNALAEMNLSLEEQVAARTKELQNAYEQVALSKHAAQLGMFDMDLKKGTMEWDSRCRELFGISHAQKVTYEHDFLSGLHPDDRERVQKIIVKLFDSSISDGNYDVEYRTVGIADGRVRWIRAKGKVYFDNSGTPQRFIGSVLDITDKKNEEQLRNGFISMASHELKTPLTSLQGYVQLLKKRHGAQGDDFTRSVLQSSERQILKMGNIINGFLNMARLESGKFLLNIQQAEIREIIKTAVEEFCLLNPAVEINLELHNTVQIQVDKEKIEHVILNLLSNAVKYSAKGAPVLVRYVSDDTELKVSVQDHGIGINETDLERIFDRFFRSPTAQDQHISGFGIGLYLCHEIISLHGGRIFAESELGKGSTFYFTLPL